MASKPFISLLVQAQLVNDNILADLLHEHLLQGEISYNDDSEFYYVPIGQRIFYFYEKVSLDDVDHLCLN